MKRELRRDLFAVTATLTWLWSAIALAADSSHDHAGHSLGKVNFPISCSTEAQTEFNRAVALLHHMTYPEARKAFEKIVQIDPDCAMAHWGVAMTLFQPLWPTRPSPKDLERGWA
jgi:Tfp pilus assembly protein PilF